MLCISNQMACHFAEKSAVFPLTLGRAALCRRLRVSSFSKLRRSKEGCRTFLHPSEKTRWGRDGGPGGRETPLARAEGFLFPPIFYELKMLYVRGGGNRRNGPCDRRGSDALPEVHALAYTARVFRLPVGQPVFSYWDVFPQGWGLLRDNRKKYGFCQQYMQLYALSHR